MVLVTAGCDNAEPPTTESETVQEPSEMKQALADKTGSMPKLGPNLIALYRSYQDYMAAGGADSGAFAPEGVLLRVEEDRVLIDAVADKNAEDLKRDLEALGLVKGSAFGRVVSGRFPIEALPAAAALESLRFARAAQPN
jgi:hypothetical protein